MKKLDNFKAACKNFLYGYDFKNPCNIVIHNFRRKRNEAVAKAMVGEETYELIERAFMVKEAIEKGDILLAQGIYWSTSGIDEFLTEHECRVILNIAKESM